MTTPTRSPSSSQIPRSAAADAPGEAMTTIPQEMWHELEATETIRALCTTERGLTQPEAAHRLGLFGENVLRAAPTIPKWRRFLAQFTSPLIIVLLICGVVTIGLQHYVDAAAILVVLLVNAILGFYQEDRADRAVSALASLSTPTARVIRDGAPSPLPTPELVPGDVVTLESGDMVPADLRLIDVTNLRINESMLTGESDDATKTTQPCARDASLGDRTCIAYSGTLVTSGRGRGVVVATGSDTELGEISDLVNGTQTVPPLRRIMNRTERVITFVVIVVAAFVFVAGAVLKGDPANAFLSAVALAVASMPEALPIVLTVAMALAVSRMAQHNAIVRTLPAVETLGSTTVIGSDKTGTLTQNRLTVESCAVGAGAPREFPPAGDGGAPTSDAALARLLRAGALTNEAVRGTDGSGRVTYSGDAVDMAMARVADLAHAVSPEDLAAPIVAETPYEPELRYSMTVRRNPDGTLTQYVKGAPGTVAAMSSTMLDDGGGRSRWTPTRCAPSPWTWGRAV